MQDQHSRAASLAHSLKQGDALRVSHEADWMAMKSGIDNNRIVRFISEGTDSSSIAAKDV